MLTLVKPIKIKRSDLINILENCYSFRDYRILPKRYFRTIHKVGVHRLIGADPRDDIEEALYTFSRDGFSMIYLYL